MSVKNKVKRCNKRIAELEKKVKQLKAENITISSYLTCNRKEIQNAEYKNNFIKMILNERKPLEHNCCRFSVSIGQLNTMKNAKLEVERNYEYFDCIDFILKV